MTAYDPHDFEDKWQSFWNERGLFDTPADPKRKFFVFEMFAYPSGDIHMGHFRNYSIGDVVARYQRMRGYDVLHPFGWDAFGLPAENAAIKHGVHPAEWTYRNIEVSRGSLQRMGISYDWDREVVTCREDFYRFTQWMFRLLWDRGLAYRAKAAVNWCPIDQTVLANEHVVNGCCWRHPDVPVETRYLEQWFFKITDYADRLLADLDRLTKWPESTVKQQRTWIGRSEGAEVHFGLSGRDDRLTVFTTRPDTLWGATFVILAPEHPLTVEVTTDEQRAAVERYVEMARGKTEIERTDATRTKDGVFTGAYATNPVNGERVPIWVADYVLATYGTGSIMGVPAHDQRDFEFARSYGLEIEIVIDTPDGPASSDEMTEALPGRGVMVSSPPFDGTRVPEGIGRVIDYLEESGWGRARVQYRLRDWLISRQRYWGCPIPMVHCPACGIVAVSEEDLPVRLPETVENFVPTGRSPLEDVPEFIETVCPSCGGPARRDPDTMDTFVCSSWYLFRYLDPHNSAVPFSTEEARKWMPADLYIGGDEHATGHLLYVRFFSKVLHDAGWLDVDEPVERLFHHGMVKDAHGDIMSKSKGNVVSPSELFERDGVDIPRLAMLFLAPSEDEILWSTKGIEGVRRFVHRLWGMAQLVAEDSRFVADPVVESAALSASSREAWRLTHRALQRTTESIEGELNFNTAIAAFMEMFNALRRLGEPSDVNDATFGVLNEAMVITARAIAPLAPHLGEELWSRFGGTPSVFEAGWPEPNPEAMVREMVEIPVQINGKVRSRLHLAPDSSREEMHAAALADARIQELLAGQDPRRVIVVPGRLVNLVV